MRGSRYVPPSAEGVQPILGTLRHTEAEEPATPADPYPVPHEIPRKY